MRTMATLSGLLLFVGLSLRAVNHPGPFPPPAEGMVRYILELPKLDDELSVRVELMVGRTIQVEEQNRYAYAGRLVQEPLDGWPYPCFVVRELGPLAATREEPHPGAGRVSRFVSLGDEPYLIRYNSRLPILIYVPQGAEVRYRLWNAGTDIRMVEKG